MANSLGHNELFIKEVVMDRVHFARKWQVVPLEFMRFDLTNIGRLAGRLSDTIEAESLYWRD